ncbi:putative endo-polygalacturonase [Helianthus debilis subsp. tardiflorus]
MKPNMKYLCVFLCYVLLVLFCPVTVIPSVYGRKFHRSCKKHHNSRYSESCKSTTIFNILSFGAKANGVSDDSKKLVAAWKAACKVGGGTLQIPSDHKFLIKPVTLQGPCMAHVVFQKVAVIENVKLIGLVNFLHLKFKLTFWNKKQSLQAIQPPSRSGLTHPTCPVVVSHFLKTVVSSSAENFYQTDLTLSTLYFIILYIKKIKDEIGLKFKQIDGTLLAPSKIGSWSKSNLYQWINFKWVQNITIQGSGAIDGQGYNWWAPMESKQASLDIKPTALRFYASEDIVVRDITIKNSPQVHLKFDNSQGVKVNNVTVLAPGNSPNTDGIHLQNTRDVEIMHSNIETGDDCVSIQTGCSNVHIHHINCGPGHGISIGGLGKDKSIACVSDIVVENSNIQDTLYGVRIKTWQGGLGLVKNITFSNIQVANVNFPIVINQYYCDKSFCKNETGSIAIKEVMFDKITGSYSTQPIHLACSKDIPCTEINLSDIQLNPSRRPLEGSQLQQALCYNSYGYSNGQLVPSSVNYCLKKEGGGGSVNQISTLSNELC